MRGWAWRPDGWEAPPDNYVEPPPQRVASPMSPQEHVDALRRSSSIYQTKPREDLNPFVPCCSLNCPHEATLWSPLGKKTVLCPVLERRAPPHGHRGQARDTTGG